MSAPPAHTTSHTHKTKQTKKQTPNKSLEQPSPDTLRAHGGGVAAYAGTPEWPVVVSNRDGVLNEYLGTKPSNANAVYVHTHTGGRRVSPELYMDVIGALRPDVYVALADEVGADAGDKRVGQSVDRTAAVRFFVVSVV